MFSETFNSQFSYNEVWFTDQNSKPLEMTSNFMEKQTLKVMDFYSLRKIWTKIFGKLKAKS